MPKMSRYRRAGHDRRPRPAAARHGTDTIGGRHQQRLARARASLGDGVAAITVDASDPASLRDFFTQVGPLDDLVLTVTRRGGAGPAGALAEQDLIGAFAGKTVAQLQAVALALPHLAPRGSITLVTAGSAPPALPGTCG